MSKGDKRLKKRIISILLILALAFCLAPFSAFAASDISGSWAEGYAQRLIDLHIMNGYPDGTFRLDNTITRGEFVKLLITMRYGNYQTYDEQYFEDVPTDKWCYSYICTASEEDVLEEKVGDAFRPDDLITREEMVVMIVNSLDLGGGSASFSDIKRTDKYYYYICAAVGNGIITGYPDNTFRPDATATRGETAAMVCRILDYITSQELTDEPDPTIELEPEEEEDDLPSTDEPVDSKPEVDADVSGKINLTWHQIYSPGVTKTGNHMDGLNVISPTWFRLVDNTGLTPYSYEHEFYPELNLYIADLGNKDYIKDCKAEGYKVWAMFNTEGSQSKASKFLNNASARKACVAKMKEYILKYDLDGINLDFENMYQSDRDVYSKFVEEMADMCHSIGRVLSVDVTKYEATSPTYSLCYDRKTIAKHADYVMLMAYDQNGTWSTTAGSVADIPWTTNALEITLKEVPANKLVLGVPFYARIWETVNGKVVKTSAVGMETVAKRIAENNAEIVYDKKTGQNYAEWTVGNSVFKVWIEDKTSIEARVDLVNDYDLAGIASWSKTFETPDIWGYIEDLLE